jgi:hypothetical protein
MGPGRARARGAGAGGVELCRPDVGREREDGSWQGEGGQLLAADLGLAGDGGEGGARCEVRGWGA